MSESIPSIEREAREYQRVADARRIAEVNRRDELPWMVGLAMLAVLALVAFVLIALGLVL